MNALQHFDFTRQETPPSSQGGAAPLKPRSVKSPRSFDEMREYASKRFSVILAKLAK